MLPARVAQRQRFNGSMGSIADRRGIGAIAFVALITGEPGRSTGIVICESQNPVRWVVLRLQIARIVIGLAEVVGQGQPICFKSGCPISLSLLPYKITIFRINRLSIVRSTH
jgi:hypothetical protein